MIAISRKTKMLLYSILIIPVAALSEDRTSRYRPASPQEINKITRQLEETELTTSATEDLDRQAFVDLLELADGFCLNIQNTSDFLKGLTLFIGLIYQRHSFASKYAKAAAVKALQSPSIDVNIAGLKLIRVFVNHRMDYSSIEAIEIIKSILARQDTIHPNIHKECLKLTIALIKNNYVDCHPYAIQIGREATQNALHDIQKLGLVILGTLLGREETAACRDAAQALETVTFPTESYEIKDNVLIELLMHGYTGIYAYALKVAHIFLEQDSPDSFKYEKGLTILLILVGQEYDEAYSFAQESAKKALKSTTIDIQDLGEKLTEALKIKGIIST